MDADFNTIRSKLVEVRNLVMQKHSDQALAAKISEIINDHLAFEKRVYLKEMALANDGIDVSEPQLIINPLHKS